MAADDLTVALDLAIVAVASRTPADEIVILTPEAGSGDLRPRAALRRLPQAQLDLDADLHGWSAADGVPLLESRPAPLEGPLGDVLPGCRSALLVPLRTVEAVVGLIALGCQDAHAFDEEDLSTVESLARPLGFAIQRFMDTGAHSQGRTRVREMATPASRPGQRRAA
jgi:GAF domain-containing protein